MKKIIVMLLVVGLLAGCSSGADESTPTEVSVADVESRESSVEGNIPNETQDIVGTESDIESEVDVRTVKTLDGEYCVFITNNSSVTIDQLDVQLLFKDSDGMMVAEESDGHDMILPGYTVVSSIKSYRIPENHEVVDTNFEIEMGVYPRYGNHSENVSVESNQGENGVMIQITNNGDIEIREIEYVVVFYLGDDISHVGYCNDIYDIKPGKTVIEEEGVYNSEFDRFEVYLNQAHTFGL